MQNISALFEHRPPIVAVITINDPHLALPLAEALWAGGITILEITLRTAHGLGAIEMLRKKMPQLCVGAGTVTTASQFAQVKNTGAHFAVSPGITQGLLAAAKEHHIPFLPGAITPSEILLGIEAGLQHLKFFPAESSGGLEYLSNLASPFPDIHFCPTGGINEGNFKHYLAASNVFCVGTTWLTPHSLLSEKNWAAIKRRAEILSGAQ